MTLIFRRGRFELCMTYLEYQDNSMRVKGAGFRWDPKVKAWWTLEAEKAMEFYDCATRETREAIHGQDQSLRQAVQESKATDASLRHDLLREPYPFQRAGIVYLLNHERSYIADEMGLGKTIQALAAIHLKKAYPCIAVVPASVKINWQREAQATCAELAAEGAVTILWGRPGEDAHELVTGHMGKTKLWIINYDILASWLPFFHGIQFQAVILDEFQYCMNAKAQRSIATEALAKDTRIRYGLTGSPIMNRPKEICHPLKIMGLIDIFGGDWKFKLRYCDGQREEIWIKDPKTGKPKQKWVWNFDGSSHLDELQLKLRQHCLVRRLKSEVLKELPPKSHQVIEFPATNGIASLLRQQQDLVGIDWAKIGQSSMTFEEAADKVNKAFNVPFSDMSRIRKDLALAKLPKCIEHHEDTLQDVEKLVIFAHHHVMVDGLMDALQGYKPVRLTGEESPTARQKAIDQFQEGDARVFIGSIKAAGVGINLFRASTCQFDELDWTPGWIDQATDRLHRIGQHSPVLAQYLVLENSLDSFMTWMLISKKRVAYAALDQKIRGL